MSAKAFAVIMKPLIDLYGEPRSWAVGSRDVYFKALRDVPERLLAHAVMHCIRTSAFFPKPVELRAAIAEELKLEWQRKLDVVRGYGSSTRALPPPEQRAEIERMEKEHKRQISLAADASRYWDA